MFFLCSKVNLTRILIGAVLVFQPITYATTSSASPEITSRSEALLEIYYNYSLAPLWLAQHLQFASIPAQVFTIYLEKLSTLNQETTKTEKNTSASRDALMMSLASFEKKAELRTTLDKQLIADNQHTVKTLFARYFSKEGQSFYAQKPEQFTIEFARAILIKTILGGR